MWHAAGGYSDIAVEAFLVGAVAAILRKEWLISGVMAAGVVWAKNDGLILYIPSLLLAIYLILVGLTALIAAFVIPPIILGVLALIAGIFILIGR